MQPSVFRSIAESASDAIVVTAHDPVQAPEGPEIIFVNDAWVRMTGYSREEAIGKTPRILQGPETDTAQTARIRQAISENRPVEVELVNYRKNGEPFWSWVQIFPISDRSGDNCYWAAIKRDITRQKQNLQEKETLIQEIHHRVKNNLAIVSGILELQTINEKDETSSVRILESLSRIKMIAGIHELLYQSDSFSRIDIKQSIESLTLGIRNTLLPNGKITFRFRIGEIDDLNINQAIPFALIINEVIANSIKHAYPDGARGEITLSLAQEGRQIVLEIADNGSGLPESFDPNAATSTGMQFIRTLTAQLKSTWRLDNRKDERGTKFRLEFLKEDVKGAHSAINDFIHESYT